MTLAEFLADRGLRPTQFARQIGVDPTTIDKVLKGRRRAGPRLREKIFRATGGAVTPTDMDGLGRAPRERADG